MTHAATNVRPLHPLRVLLVTDDDAFAERVSAAAEAQGLPLACASRDDDLSWHATEHRPNVVALDARTSFGRTARSATAFAHLHPRIAVVMVAGRTSPRSVPGLRVVGSWRPPERLLDDLRRVHVGLDR